MKKDGVEHISIEGEPHFILKEGERCPYLNNNDDRLDERMEFVDDCVDKNRFKSL